MTEMNRKYLRKRPSGGFAAVYFVPTEFRAKLGGKREIVRGLGTNDEKEAMRRKTAKLLEIQAEVHRLVNGELGDTAWIMKEAAEYARMRRGIDPDDPVLDGIDLQISNTAEIIADHDKTDSRAHRFADIAFGRSIPISVAVQDWRRVAPREIDIEVYKWRHLIKNFFCKLKEFKRIALRACKTDSSFSAMIYIAAAVINSR